MYTLKGRLQWGIEQQGHYAGWHVRKIPFANERIIFL